MVELTVDPAFDDVLEVAEVTDHVTVVERGRPNLDLSDGIVPVRMFADTLVVQQAMAVAEVDPLGDGVHRRSYVMKAMRW